MKIGGFGHLSDYAQIAAAGYDYAELDIPEIAALEEPELTALQAQISSKIPVPIASRLLPAAEALFFRPDFNPESLADCLKTSCRKTAQLGVRAVILGNGKARSTLHSEDAQHDEVFIEALRLMARTAASYQQELILEPLGPRYSNYINTLEQAVSVIERAGEANIFTMADLRHMVGAGEDFADLKIFLPYIHHLHIDYPLSFPERRYPSLDDDYDYSGFLGAVSAAGFNGTITVEADVPADWQAAHAQITALLEALCPV